MEAGRPSETAARIALQRVSAARDPFHRRLLGHPDEPYSAWFAEEHSPAARAEVEEHRSGAPKAEGRRRLADVLDPGGVAALLARKRFVEDEVRASLEAGAGQVVVLGAGYDPLPLLLGPEFPRVRFFELDHPATQAVKRRALERHQALPPALTLVPVDFATESLEAALGRVPGFRPGAAFVAEGLLMYLAPRDLDALLGAVVRLAGPGSRVVCSLLDRRAAQDRRRGVGRTATLAGHLGEPVRSTHSVRALPRFLSRRGLRPRRICGARELFRLYLEQLGAVLPPREGEVLVSAEVAP